MRGVPGFGPRLPMSQDRRGEPAGAAAERALAELLAVHPDDLGDDRRPEYVDAVLRVSAIRWAGAVPAPQPGPPAREIGLALSTSPGSPGQTCVALEDAHRPRAAANHPALYLWDREDGLDPGHPSRSGAGARGAAARELARALGIS